MNNGERVGDYEIVEILGAGGMGQVYKVRNILSERIEAMKILLPNMGSNPELGDRFLREIKVQAALDHPHIARLYTAQQIGDRLLMFMEFVDGDSIDKLLKQGSLNLEAALRCASEVLDALSYAHGRGVVHRDIKPGNIMRNSAGVTKLMDFGIARMQADRRLTQTGGTVGSLYYMSPEQINGAEPDPRSDLYSLGVTLYEMVTGRKPFQGDSDYSIMAGHLEQAPAAPIEVVPGIPGDLNDIILLAIAKDPQQRFQSADAFRKALSSISAGSTPPAAVAAAPAEPPPLPIAAVAASQPRSRRGLYMMLGSIATLAVLAVAIWQGPKYLHVHAGEAAAPAPPQTSLGVDTFTNTTINTAAGFGGWKHRFRGSAAFRCASFSRASRERIASKRAGSPPGGGVQACCSAPAVYPGSDADTHAAAEASANAAGGTITAAFSLRRPLHSHKPPLQPLQPRLDLLRHLHQHRPRS